MWFPSSHENESLCWNLRRVILSESYPRLTTCLLFTQEKDGGFLFQLPALASGCTRGVFVTLRLYFWGVGASHAARAKCVCLCWNWDWQQEGAASHFSPLRCQTSRVFCFHMTADSCFLSVALASAVCFSLTVLVPIPSSSWVPISFSPLSLLCSFIPGLTLFLFACLLGIWGRFFFPFLPRCSPSIVSIVSLSSPLGFPHSLRFLQLSG